MNTINSINLDRVINRMVKIHHWRLDATEEVSRQYRNFLYLKKKYGTRYSLPPSIEVDEFWHNHILHTYAYHNDCIHIFGEYLHHYPHLDSEAGYLSQENLEDRFNNETQRLYFEEFGEFLYEINPKQDGESSDEKKITQSVFA